MASFNIGVGFSNRDYIVRNIAIGNRIDRGKEKRREKRKKLWHAANDCFEGDNNFDPTKGFIILDCLIATKQYNIKAKHYKKDLLRRKDRCLDAMTASGSCFMKMGISRDVRMLILHKLWRLRFDISWFIPSLVDAHRPHFDEY